MKIDLHRLEEVAVDESRTELKLAADSNENGDMYKASFRIAMKIKRALRLKNMTQAHLSELMNVDPAIISRYMTGKANMELKTIVKIEKALGINIIDSEISPKKKKNVIILSRAFENEEIFKPINKDDMSIHKQCAFVNADASNIMDEWDFTEKLNSDYITLPVFDGERLHEEPNIKFLDAV